MHFLASECIYIIVFAVIHFSSQFLIQKQPFIAIFLGFVSACSMSSSLAGTLHKIIFAHHDKNCECECDCGFCVSCGDLDTLSIGGCMRLMLCPPSVRFHGSSIPLFDWNVLRTRACFFYFSLFKCSSFW